MASSSSINTFSEKYPEPEGYTILEYGTPYFVIGGPASGQYRNMYWKVLDKNETKDNYPQIYYLIY